MSGVSNSSVVSSVVVGVVIYRIFNWESDCGDVGFCSGFI